MRKLCMTLAVLLAISFLYACSKRNDTYAIVFAEAERLNNDNNFREYELLGEASQEGPEEYTAGESECFTVYGNDGDFLLFRTYSPYPYDSETLRLTEFTIYDPDGHIYGIQIGNTLEEGFQKLLESGYTKKGGSDVIISTQKDHIIIDLMAEIAPPYIDQINVTVYDPFKPDPLSQSQADYSFHRDEVYALAQELNDNSDFGGLALTGAVPENLRRSLNYEPFVTDPFSIDNVDATYWEFDYDGRLMEILLKSNAYNVLGVKVGDSVKESGAKLAKFGYEFTGEDDSDFSDEHYFFYNKGEYAYSSIRLVTYPGDTKIGSIYIIMSDNYERELLGAY